ncbi:Uncharacterised protein [Anaerobiospirillum thomasii]|uniref:Uncharacterized protein n=1 Tax=Anaerobiospirillum thomasii TaxID=179995 RepID=A0A2X0V6W2_9GAMM|nr:hypothetical protein [Anaerobiospirillum thomasii]SPT70089.1 Uncharacterised protein [Anaerobiospirillum thomasii]SPT72437.1 Uncharacterised protein [Anaerobiospirillum thomasii]
MIENKKQSLPWFNADGIDAPGDEIPELTPELINKGNVYIDGKLVKRKGRQTEINALLRKSMV